MLPFLQIITPKIPGKMSSSDVVMKSRRKKVVEVPVHVHRRQTEQNEQERSPSKRKRLQKENVKLAKENEELLLKFSELEELSVRKITKLREKINALQNYNAEVLRENESLKEQLQLEVEAIRVCKVCQDFQNAIEKIATENNSLRTSNKELVEDLDMLKTVIFRLNVQMERYQEKLRKDNLQVVKIEVESSDAVLSEAHQDHSHTPITWGSVNSHTLGPLLDAYQDTISEKEDIILSYEVEISNFTGKLKEVLKENDNLHEKLVNDDQCSSKLKVQLEDAKSELKTIREQNDVLIKKCAMKQDKLEEILKCYENKVEQLKRDYTVAQDQYFKCRSEAAALKEKNKSLIDSQEDFRNERQTYIPVSVHNASVNECKKWYEELKVQYENEKIKLKENVESQSRTIEELNKKTKLADEKNLHLEKHIKKSESKFLELEHTLNGVQLSRSACRKQLHKVMHFAKDMVTEQETLLKALNQRHLENKAVKKIGSDMATKMDSLKSQLKDVQKTAWQEFSTVEQRIQEQDELIDSMKQEHLEEVERLKSIIKKQEDNILLKNDNLPLPQYLLFKDKYNLQV